MRLLSNNLRKLAAIEGYRLSVTEWLPLEIPASASTLRYLTTKRNKLGHALAGFQSLRLTMALPAIAGSFASDLMTAFVQVRAY